MSLNLTDAAAFRAYVERFDFDLLSTFFAGFQSKPFLTANFGVKGQLVKTQMEVEELTRRFSKNFTPPADLVKLIPRVGEVYAAKIEAQMCPQDFESTYLAMAREPGFSHAQLPFEGYMLMNMFKRNATSVDRAMWRGVKAVAPTANDPVYELFDGYLTQIIAGLVAGDLTAVATGAITNSNAVASCEMVYTALPAEAREEEIILYVSVPTYDKYVYNYRESYSKFYTKREVNGLEQIKLDIGNAWVTPIIAMSTSQRIIATPKKNMDWLTDQEGDMNFLRFQDSHWNIDMFGAYKLGANIPILSDLMMKVNNQE